MRLKHETRIKKNFHSKASHRLSEMFIKARKDGKKLKWMFDRRGLLAKWNLPEYHSKC